MRHLKKACSIAVIVLFFLIGCTAATRPEWSRADECFALIRKGGGEKVISDAKSIITGDRWNADAHSCLVMAYYSGNRKHLASKRLAEAADAIPKEHVDKIHDILWEYVPEFLAEREYSENFTLYGGDCLLRNVKALKGSGLLIIGRFFDPKESREVRHVMGYKCGRDINGCEEVDKTCPDCSLLEPEAVILISNYMVTDIQHIMPKRPITRNVKYIKRLLEIEGSQ